MSRTAGSAAADVQAALAYVASLQPGHDESYEGEEKEVLLAGPSGGLSKNESLHQERIRKLEISLAQSKQRVIQHLLQSRQIQKAITESEIVENAVKSHIESKANELKIAKMRSGGDRANRRTTTAAPPGNSDDANTCVWYDTPMLELIAHAAQLAGGGPCASSVQRAINVYDDRALRDELDDFAAQGFSSVDEALFAQVAVAASNARVTAYDAGLMFRLGQRSLESRRAKPRYKRVSESGSESGSESDEQWALLSSILRKKLKMLYVGAAVRSFLVQAADGAPSKPASSTVTGPVSGAARAKAMPGLSVQPPPPTSSAAASAAGLLHSPVAMPPPLGSPAGNKTSFSFTSSAVSVALTPVHGAGTGIKTSQSVGALERGKGASLLRAGRSPGSAASHDPQPALQRMAQLLHKTQLRQQELSERIVSNLALVSQSVAFGGKGSKLALVGALASAEEGHDEGKGGEGGGSAQEGHSGQLEHASAVAFAVRMSVRKIEGLLLRVARRELVEAWRRWLSDIAAHKAEQAATHCIHHFGAVRLFQGLETCLNSKLKRALKNFKARVVWLGGTERLAAVIETQRYWRGCLARLRRWHAVRRVAATMLQCLARRKIARRVVRYRRMQAHFRHSVQRIEKAYLNFRWRLIGRNIRAFQWQQNMAARLQRFYRGHRARRRVAKIRLRLRRTRGAIKMQSLWRRFKATVRVDKLALIRKRRRAAVKMQSVARGMLGRIKAARVREFFMAARTLQCLARSRRARNERRRRLQRKSAMLIQRIARGRLGRKRFKMIRARRIAYMLNRRKATAAVAPLLIGHYTRRIWRPRIRAHVARRRAATIKIQAAARRWLARRRVDRIRRERAETAARIARELADAEFQRVRRNNAAGLIQRVLRGSWGRRRAVDVRVANEKAQLARQYRLRAYYRLKEDYYREQNTFHRPYVLRMQCFLRVRRAVRRVEALRRQRAAKRVQKAWAHFKTIQAAKKRVGAMREERRRLNFAATQIERVVRGFMGRYEFRKHELILVQKWFLQEIKQLGLIGQALTNFRIRKRTLERINRGVVKIQATVRRFLQRCKFLRGYKRLVRDREARRKARRNRAATTIIGLARIFKAKKLVARRRKIVAEERRLKASMDELEGRIDGVHTDLMTDLMTARAQSGVRGMLGKKATKRREAEVAAEAKKSEAQRRAAAATKIQAMTRGVQSRLRFKKALPALTKERTIRSFCVECEVNVATKRCRQCKDRYCDVCYTKMHRKGARRQHAWDPVQVSQAVAKAAGKQGLGKDAGHAPGPGHGPAGQGKAAPVVNKKDWEKHWDNAAKAHYWFNAKTGEASWVNPFP